MKGLTLFTIFLVLLLMVSTPSSAQSISTVTATTVEFHCKFKAPSNGGIIQWVISSNPRRELSANEHIFLSVPIELRSRLNITGNHSSGEYNLMISDIKKADEGQYDCVVYGDLSKVHIHQLVVIVGPTSVIISGKTQQNKLVGTENQDLAIKCTANGGDPAPNMKLLVGNEVFQVTSRHTIQHTKVKVNKTYDGVNITCQAAYDGVIYTPLTDTVVIELNLKPNPPSFSMNPVVTENTKLLVVTCTSTGSRPAPTERIWIIGDSNVDITSSSTPVSSSLQSDGTHTATSTQTYRVNKVFNQQNITCGFKNIATGNSFASKSRIVVVKYAPSVSVKNSTFTLSQTQRVITCVVDSNPVSSFSRWQHKSVYGELIRELDSGSTLVVPQQLEQNRYQDTGEYVCTANNGIRDKDGNTYQNGFGYVISEAPPHFLNRSGQIIYGQYGKSVNIPISVYSKPKYTELNWLKDGSPLSQSNKYIMSDVAEVITDTFFGTEVKVDGFRVTLTLTNLEENDFVNYTLRLNNGIGNTADHLVVLFSLSPPEVPINFTEIDVTESTVTLQWKEANDGGNEQTFVIQYRIKGFKGWEEKLVPSNDKTSSNGLHVFVLSNLEDGTLYEIRIYAQNIVDRSPQSSVEHISTRCLRCKEESCTVTGVAVGLSTVIIISLTVNVVTVYRLVTGKSLLGKPALKVDSTKINSNPEVYYNITGDKDENSDVEGCSYEALGTKDKPNVYEDLDKKSKGEATNMSARDYEALRTTDKPNIYDDLNQ